MNDLNMARKWAKASKTTYMGEYERAAAELILSLQDEWIDAEKLREVIEEARLLIRDGEPEIILNDLAALLPAPRPRTLAGMTAEEREACRWMQAISDPDSGYTDGPVVIVQVQDDRCMLMWGDGSFDTRYHQHITPLPDLPKLEWPSLSVSDESEAVSVETEESEGLPRPEDVPAGEPWIVEYDGHKWVGTRDSRGRANWPWVLARLDGVNCCIAHDSDITLVSRLAPEVTA